MDKDHQLIYSTAQGDADAFEALVKKYERPVLATIYRYLGDAHTAQDIAQEVFLKVWQKAGQFKHKSSFSTWLYRIVVNQCLTYREKGRRRENVPLQEDLTAEGSDIERKLDERRRGELVQGAVQGLPGRQRMALILSHFEGHSYKEIARMMETTRSSVESLIFRAKQNLKRELLPLRDRGEI